MQPAQEEGSNGASEAVQGAAHFSAFSRAVGGDRWHMKRWDAFISHASEDKEAVVTPLAAALRAAGLTIWVDQEELRLGDRLREKIDEGLAASRFGIVVLSPSFLAKRWAARELNGLLELEEVGHKVIVPVWHGIDKDVLRKHSPILAGILADRLAADTSRGIENVASEIIRVIVDPASASPAVESPSLARRFIQLLDGAPETPPIRDFLRAHPQIVQHAAGGQLVSTNVRLDNLVLDLTLSKTIGSSATRKWTIVQLVSPSQHPFPQGAEPATAIRDIVSDLETFRRRIPQSLQAISMTFPDFNASFQAMVVAGRRSMLTADDRERMRRYNEELFGITLRTYDWLVESAVSVQVRHGD